MKIISPLEVPTGKKKFILNLNNYRNTHYILLNKAKQNYFYMIKSHLKHLKGKNYDKAILTYTLYPKSARLTDLDNVISIHQKFFQDALVKEKVIKEDNYKHISHNIQKFGAIDKNNPRVEIEIDFNYLG